MLYFQLCSACYTVLQMWNTLRTASAIDLATTEIWMIFITSTNIGKPSCTSYPELTPCAVSKDKWDICDACIVHTAVCQKAPVRLKLHLTVKKSSS